MTTSTAGGAPVRDRLRSALATATARLGAAGVPSPSVDARALIALAARTDQPLVMLDHLPESFDEDLDVLIGRREAREPLQLIQGYAAFRRLRLEVAPGVFIPRPETELAVDLLQQHRRGPLRRVADLCTGSGALAAALLDELPEVHVTAADVDDAAVALARRNTAPWARRAEVLQADLTTAPDTTTGGEPGLERLSPLDAIVSNPPYVPLGAVPQDEEVRRHDPPRALYGGGEDGLDLPRAVIAWAHRLLRPGGLLVMEHADVQGEATRALAARIGGFEDVATCRDLTGRDRFLVARRTAATAAGFGSTERPEGRAMTEVRD